MQSEYGDSYYESDYGASIAPMTIETASLRGSLATSFG